MTPTNEQLKELVARLRSAGADGDAIHCWNSCVVAADALAAIIAEREKAEPVAWRVTFMRSTGNDYLIVHKQADAKKQVSESLIISVDPIYTAPPDLEFLLARVAELERAIDEHMVVSHIGTFESGDDPKIALNKIACYEQGLGEYFGKDMQATIASQAEQIESLLEALDTMMVAQTYAHRRIIRDAAIKNLR